MSAAGDRCQCRVRFLISFRCRGQKRASRSAAAINTGRYAQCRATATVLRTLALLLAALSRATPKQAKEPIISTNDIEKLDFIRVNKLALSNEFYDYKK